MWQRKQLSIKIKCNIYRMSDIDKLDIENGSNITEVIASTDDIITNISVQDTINHPGNELVIANKEICNKPLYNNLKKRITEKLNDQDFMQRIYISINVVIELYRVLSSSLLILFVPQICKGSVCSISQNMVTDDTTNPSFSAFYYTTLSFNFFTLAFFLLLYRIELVRENRLIKYLDVNNELPTDDKDVEKTLKLLPLEKRNKILSIDKYYQLFGYISIGVFIVNVVFSSFVVNAFYLGNQTATTMITYVLFMLTKLVSVYNVANTHKNTFYSAYLKANVQYNDIDKRYKTKT
jgi:hypothetical protein